MKPEIIRRFYPRDPRCPMVGGCNCGGPTTNIPEEYLYEEDLKRIKEWKEYKKQIEIKDKQSLEQVKNNPDPEYPWGCSPPASNYMEPQIHCLCAQQLVIRDKRNEKNNYLAFTPSITPTYTPAYTPSMTPRPEGLTDPSGSRILAPSIAPRPEGLTDPLGSRTFTPGITPLYSFFVENENLILGGLALITIIIMIIMFKKFN